MINTLKSCFAAVVLAFMAIGTVSAQMQVSIDKHSPVRKLQIAEMAITNLYVDSVDENKLVEDAIRGMLEKLDPHSAYSTAKETKAMNEPLQGSFDGIGIEFNIAQDTLLVIQPTLGGPSEKVGILAGDRIITVNDTVIAGVKMERTDIVKRLRGKRGTKVKLGVMRRGIKDVLTFTVTRDRIPLKTIDASYMIAPTVGYVRIGSFGMTTYDEFMASLDSLQQHGMQDLIIDLQDNGGGLMQAAVSIANEFLSREDLIVYMQGKASERREYRSDGKGRMRNGKVVKSIIR